MIIRGNQNMTQNMSLITTKQFFEISNGSELSLFDFFGTWCAPCDYQTEEFDKEMGNLIKVYPEIKCAKIDVDKAEGLFGLLGFQAVPQLFVVYKKRIGIMHSGFTTMKDIIKFIQTFIKDTDNHPEKIPKTELSNESLKQILKQSKKKR